MSDVVEVQVPCPSCGGYGYEVVSQSMASDAGDETMTGARWMCSACNGGGFILEQRMTDTKKLKHVVNGDERGGWYCYACRFSSRNVSEAAAHDGTFTTPEQSEYATFTPPASQPTVTASDIWLAARMGDWKRLEELLKVIAPLLRAAEQK